MGGSSALTIVFAIALLYFVDPLRGGRFDWMTVDNFDTINNQLIALQKTNCRTNPSARLPYETLAQMPRFNQLLQVIIYQNRTKLLHVHNSALTRAYYLAFIYQVLNKSQTDFAMQAGMEYYYYSQAADLIANPYSINGSAIFMDNNCTYANWYQNLLFNNTLPLFGPRAWRLDDYNQPYNWLREPTNTTIYIEDYAAGSNFNYTSASYGNNPWYTDTAAQINYLPDLSASQTTVQKYQYYVGIMWAKSQGKFYTGAYDVQQFFGPPLPGQKDTYLPVMFTSPYFDCARTNHWIVSAVAPIVDFMPRYSIWFQVRRARYTGVVVMDTDFLQIDINQCPTSPGNQPPNYFAGTARCKPTTQCMPLMGWGFRRGGYQCMCLPGYRYPFWQNGPFQGLDIEQATEQEYATGFDCLPVGWMEVWPFTAGISTSTGGTSTVTGRRKRSVNVDDSEVAEVDDLVDGILNGNCSSSQSPGRASWVSDTVSSALRYAGGFVSSFFGNSRPSKNKQMQTQHFEQTAVADDVIQEYVQQQAQTDSADWNTLNADIVRKILNESASSNPQSVLFDNFRLRNDSESSQETKQSRGGRKFVLKNKNATKEDKDKSGEKEHKRYKRGLPYNGAITDIDSNAYQRAQSIFSTIASITQANCAKYTAAQLRLPGDVAYGVETMFDNQARTALRLASFLSAFMQNEDPTKVFGNFQGDQPLNVYQVFGEAVANVMGDLNILSSGVFFDQNAFVHPNGTVVPYFAPYAFRPTTAQAAGITGSSTTSGDQSQTIVTATNVYLAVDYTGFTNPYVNEPWFSTVKQRWGSNTYGLQKLLLLPYVRSDIAGAQLKNFEQYPIYYRSPSINDGFWTSPYFECNMLNTWVVTFSAPFFGWNALKTAIQFKGAVTVTVALEDLDIDQCPAAFFVPNAFANTARCDIMSTYCQHIPGRGFTWGGYKCECRQGYEYPFDDGRTWYFDGMTMESQYTKYLANSSDNYFSILKCREAGAAQITFSTLALLAAFVLPFAFF